METFDAIVIGAGKAGAEVAARALEDGRRVALVYKSPYGSTCLNTGCVPSKFLIERARAAHRRPFNTKEEMDRHAMQTHKKQ